MQEDSRVEFPAGCRALAAGQNSSGECGLGLAQHVVREFAPLPGPTRLTAAACGGGYTVVYDEQRVETYNCGEQGSGSGCSHPQRVLVIVPALCGIRVRAFACGLSHSLAMSEDGLVLAWGRNADGQCGAPLNFFHISAPRVVEGLRSRLATHAACGAYHSLVGTAQTGGGGCKVGEGEGGGESALFAFGWHNYGQLGVAALKNASAQLALGGGSSPDDDDYIDVVNQKLARPQRVMLPDGVCAAGLVSVAAGGWHSLCATACGSVFTWGCNDEVCLCLCLCLCLSACVRVCECEGENQGSPDTRIL
jgi:hypothetical protein